jgi:hypothetical protein
MVMPYYFGGITMDSLGAVFVTLIRKWFMIGFLILFGAKIPET